MFHNGMGVINCSLEFFKNSTPGLDIRELFPGELMALLAHPRRVINSSPEDCLNYVNTSQNGTGNCENSLI
jgi:hypothetical protein